MRFNLVSCEIFYREMNAAIAKSPHHIEIQFLPKGLHDIPCREMLSRVQEAVDKAALYVPDLVILDLTMPGMDGVRTFHELQKSVRT